MTTFNNLESGASVRAKINEAINKVDGATPIASADINGGTIDGTVIGGSTPAAISGTTITGTSFVTTGDMTFGDNDKAIFGAGSDLQIFHSGSASYILEGGTGELILQSDGSNISMFDGGGYMLRANNAGSVQLYYNRVEKLATTSTGVDVTGTIVGDGLTVDAANGLVLESSGATEASWTHHPATGESTISVGRSVGWGGDLNINTDTLRRMRIQNNGDISFYEDTGTTPKFFWDASAESLGIGTTSPAAALHVSEAGGDFRLDRSGNEEYTVIAGTAVSGAVFHQYFNRTTSAYIDSISRATTHQFRRGGDGTEAMRITSNGNVGIGTTSPLERLSIVSSDIYQFSFKNNSASSIGALGYDSTDNMRVYVNGSERMRIDSSGNLLVGTTTNTASSKIMVSATAQLTLGSQRDGTATQTHFGFYNPNGQVGTITTSGTSTSYNTSSDYRLKEDVQPMVGATDRLMDLKPVNFAWKADGTRVDGFLAHEAQEVVPQAVTGEKDGEDMQAIDHSKLVPLLTAALQEALAEIATLKANVAALKGQ